MIYIEAINIVIPIIVTDFIQCIATKDLGTLYAIFFRAVGLASIAWLALPICIIILLAILLIIRAKGTKEAA